MVFLQDTLEEYLKGEADRVLQTADAAIDNLKRKAEKSTDYEEIKRLITTVENIEKQVHIFKGDIPSPTWREYQVRDMVSTFIFDGDKVLDLCQ